MHEYSIAYDIYATAKHAAESHGATQITCIHVDVGEMAMVNAEQVQFLFTAICADDPLFSLVSLDCRPVKPRVKCSCGYEGGERFVCPSCGGLPELLEGREIVVTNIEIEVDDEEEH
jgi:hydrogenase nickel incorporation protein HypA/HybF